jgi:hypothetical protein
MNGQSDQVPPNGKPRRWRTLLFALAGLIVLYFAYRHGLSAAIQARIDAIHRAGFPATCAELNTWYPQPPAGQNAADLYEEAATHYNKWTSNDTARAKLNLLPVVGIAKFPARTEPLAADTQRLAAEYLGDNAEALRLLHQAAAVKQCRYPIDLSQGPLSRLNHLEKLRQAARLLDLEVIENAEQQKPEQVTESVISLCGIVRSLHQEPLMISYLVSFACQGIALSSLDRALNRIALTDEQLVKLASGLGEAPDHQPLTPAFVGERCLGTDAFEGIRTGKLSLKDAFGFLGDQPQCLPQLAWLYKVTGLLELDEKSFLDIMQRNVTASQLSPPESIAIANSISNTVANLPERCVGSRMLLSGLERVFSLAARYDARLRDAQAAIAIERSRLATGKLPDQLGDLVPKFLPAVPADPFDGEPLRYRKLARGYVVYSVGEDMVDNGGAEKNSQGLSYAKGADITFTVER